MFRVVLLANMMIFMEMFMRALSKSKLKYQHYQQCKGCHLLNNTVKPMSIWIENSRNTTVRPCGQLVEVHTKLYVRQPRPAWWYKHARWMKPAKSISNRCVYGGEWGGQSGHTSGRNTSYCFQSFLINPCLYCMCSRNWDILEAKINSVRQNNVKDDTHKSIIKSNCEQADN